MNCRRISTEFGSGKIRHQRDVGRHHKAADPWQPGLIEDNYSVGGGDDSSSYRLYGHADLIPTSCEFDSLQGFPSGKNSESMEADFGGLCHGFSDRLAG